MTGGNIWQGALIGFVGGAVGGGVAGAAGGGFVGALAGGFAGGAVAGLVGTAFYGGNALENMLVGGFSGAIIAGGMYGVASGIGYLISRSRTPSAQTQEALTTQESLEATSSSRRVWGASSASDDFYFDPRRISYDERGVYTEGSYAVKSGGRVTIFDVQMKGGDPAAQQFFADYVGRLPQGRVDHVQIGNIDFTYRPSTHATQQSTVTIFDPARQQLSEYRFNR
jgi:hypothetical protein